MPDFPDVEPDPPGPWLISQTWHNLLFIHWPLPPAALHPFVPPGLALDTWDGQAWLGIVPFWITNRFHGLPPIPGTAVFNELNVRTYVVGEGGPGVLFLSLDADNALAVIGARAGFFLPYFNARLAHALRGDAVRFTSRRMHPLASPAAFAASYAPTSDVFFAQPGSLDHWLTHRLRLFTPGPGGRLYRAEIRHAPWPLQHARLTLHRNTMAQAHGLTLPASPPVLHYAQRLIAYFWPRVRARPL